MTPPAIAITNLAFRWRQSDAFCLELANAMIDAGKSLFLHGPSGNGKSTLLNLIGGVLLPARGSVSLLGQPFGELSTRRRDAFRADHLGFIFQRSNLIPYLSVLDNVLRPRRFSARRAKRVSELEREARRLLTALDLDTGTDLIVGARCSPLQLVLYAVFHVGEASNNVDRKSYQTIAADPAVAWSVPLALGDSHRGFPVLGTTPAYFEHYRYGNRQPLRFTGGQPFSGLFDAVFGAEVAATLGYRLGERITLSRGSGQLPGLAHADKPFTVAGILAPTGTPADRRVHVSLAAIEAIHLDWQGGAPIPGVVIPADMIGKFDRQPKTITAFLLGLHHRTAVCRLQRPIAEYRAAPMLAVLPGVALGQLWQTVGVVEKALLGISWLVFAVGLTGLAAVSIAAWLGGPWLAAQFSLSTLPLAVSPGELRLLAAVFAAALQVSLWPAWRAYGLSLADGLIPRL